MSSPVLANGVAVRPRGGGGRKLTGLPWNHARSRRSCPLRRRLTDGEVGRTVPPAIGWHRVADGNQERATLKLLTWCYRRSAVVSRGAALPVVAVPRAVLPVVAVPRAILPVVAVPRAILPMVAVPRAVLPVVAVAITAPVPLVVGITIAVKVVVATAPVPVVTPTGIPPFTRAPVVSGWGDRLGLRDCRSPQTREPQTCGHY